MHHLFFQCPKALQVWRLIGINPDHSFWIASKKSGGLKVLKFYRNLIASKKSKLLKFYRNLKHKKDAK
jgi:hypothetical protein